MKLIIAMMLVFSLSAFAAEKISFVTNFDAVSCSNTSWVEEDTCTASVEPSQRITINLGYYTDGVKQGSYMLTKETSEGTFTAKITVMKDASRYVMTTTFFDPDGFESQGQSFEFYRLSNIRGTMTGQMWGTDGGYLLPTLSVNP